MKVLLRRPTLGIVALVALAVLLTAAVLAQRCQREHRPDNALVIDLGYERELVKATFLADVCSPATDLDEPECARPAPDPTKRPTIEAVQFAEVPKTEDGRRLPSSAFTMSAESIGADGLSVALSFDPGDVGEIKGIYVGRVVVLRATGDPVTVSVAVVADSRNTLLPVALWCLFVGAGFGLVIRWFNNIGAPLSALYRKLRRLRRMVSSDDRRLLPSDVSIEFTEADESLGAIDVASFTAQIGRIEADVAPLRQLSKQLRLVERTSQRAKQLAVMDDPAPGVPIAAGRVAYALDVHLRRIQDAPWPWGDTAAVKARLETIDRLGKIADDLDAILDGASTGDGQPVGRLRAIAAAISTTGPDALFEQPVFQTEATNDELQIASQGVTDQNIKAVTAAVGRREPAHDEAGAAASGPTVATRSDTETWAAHLTTVAGAIPSLSLLVGVALAGYLTKVESGSYSGSLRDAIGLWTWSFGVAVTGGTVVSVLGQLTGGQPTASATASTTTPAASVR